MLSPLDTYVLRSWMNLCRQATVCREVMGGDPQYDQEFSTILHRT
jgi:hypothetical protein